MGLEKMTKYIHRSHNQMETIYQTAQNVVAQIPMLMSDDETIESPIFDSPPPSDKANTLPRTMRDFNNQPTSSTQKPPKAPVRRIGDRIMQEEVPLLHRDEHELNRALDIHFLDIFGEPDPTLHSLDCLWTNSFRVFEITKLWTYRIFALIFGLPIAFIFGLVFALASFQYIWCFHPLRRLFIIQYMMVKQVWAALISGFLRPLCLSCGGCFSNIRLHNSNGPYIKEHEFVV